MELWLYCATLGFLVLCCNCAKQERTKSEAAALIERAGGFARLRGEAEAVFKRFGTARTRPLYDEQLKEFPGIISLGKAVVLYGEDAGTSPHISIRFGVHRESKFILIFKDAKSTRVAFTKEMIEISTNIFLRIPDH